jgi:hypothetical protein
MKHLTSTAAVAVTVIVVCGFADAQQKPDAESAEYAHLKVLEPLLGNYRAEWTVPESGDKGESKLKISWNWSKNMLIAESQYRTLEAGTNHPTLEWTSVVRLYFVWNHQDNRIESIDVKAWNGTVSVSEVTAKGDGVFSFSTIRTTDRPGGNADIAMIATEQDLTVKFTNIKTPDGETGNDNEFKYTRVKE